ncbi:MAG: POTRA domain-containing protein, partial [Gemmatimonadaceae bacterium]
MHLPRRFGRWALVLVASAFLAPPVSAQLIRRDLSPTPEVKSVDFNGVSKAVDIDELQASIYTEPTRCRSFVLSLICKFARYRGFQERHFFNRQELQRDIVRIRVFYYKHGFREAEVDTAVTRLDDKHVAVKFDIREGPAIVVKDVAVAYDSTLFSPRQVRQLTLLKRDENLDLFVFDSTRVNFQNALWDRGYSDALVDTSTVVDPIAHTASVQIRLVKNHLTTVGDISITGTEQVAPGTVLNSLSFRPGDLFRRSSMIESQRNLYESNLFKLAALEVGESFDSVKTVNVVVREAPLHEARIGAGFNTVDYLQTEGRFTHHNLFGGARRLDISATLGNLGADQLNGVGIFHRVRADTSITGDEADFLRPNWQASIELRQPAWLQRPRNALSVGAFASRRSVPSVVIDRGYGANLTYTRTLALRAPASLSYR